MKHGDAKTSRRKRQPRSDKTASQKALLDAFEALLANHGAKNIGVNAVLGEANVGKRLLYQYFGDLQGLAAAWSEERRDPLELGKRQERLTADLRGLPRRRRVGEILVDYATMLREHPWAAQVMLAELSHPDSFGKPLRTIRMAIGKGHESLLLETGSLGGPHALAGAFVLHAAAAYLALRARLAPDYNGVDLSSEPGWQAAMDMLRITARGPGHSAESERPAKSEAARKSRLARKARDSGARFRSRA